MKFALAVTHQGREELISVFDAATWAQAEMLKLDIESLSRPKFCPMILREATHKDHRNFKMAGIVMCNSKEVN
ncbi:MAG: hypothetical protein WA728_37445 [Xanthobacteraceae bacterium]